MIGGADRWLLRFAPHDDAVLPVSGAAALDRAVRALGSGPVRWAVEQGAAMAATIVAEMPLFGGTPDAFDLLRTGTEAVSVQSLLIIAGASDEKPGPTDALEGVAEFVRHGIGLEAVLRGIRLGHAQLLRSLLFACEQLVSPDHRIDEVKRISDATFAYVDVFSATMTEQYVVEQVRWSTSALAARTETVKQLLSEHPVDQQAAAVRLDYPLAARHQAIVMWTTATGSDVTTVELHRTAADLLRRAHSPRQLLLPVSGGTVWIWTRTEQDLSATFRTAAERLPGHIHIAVGRVEAGLTGFRRSHLQAVAASALVRSLERTQTVVVYDDVELASLLLEDRERAAGFAARLLGSLLADQEQITDLRETLRVYLEQQGSTQGTARRLHLARNTVTYRLHRIEEALGAPVAGRVLELHAALLIAEMLRPLRSQLPFGDAS